MASILVRPIYLAKFTNGETLGLTAFVAAIIGGFNQVRGAMLGGLLLGVLDNLSPPTSRRSTAPRCRCCCCRGYPVAAAGAARPAEERTV